MHENYTIKMRLCLLYTPYYLHCHCHSYYPVNVHLSHFTYTVHTLLTMHRLAYTYLNVMNKLTY